MLSGTVSQLCRDGDEPTAQRPMFQQRQPGRDLAALALLAATMLLAVSLATYDPADPPGQQVLPPNTEAANACGAAGAVVADVLLAGWGVGAYYVVVSLGVLAAVLLSRRPLSSPRLRFCGWLMSLLGLCALAALALPDYTPGPVIGAGGYVGAAARALLEQYLARTGSFILAASVTAGGLLLAADYLLLRVVLAGLLIPWRWLVRLMRHRGKVVVEGAEDGASSALRIVRAQRGKMRGAGAVPSGTSRAVEEVAAAPPTVAGSAVQPAAVSAGGGPAAAKRRAPVPAEKSSTEPAAPASGDAAADAAADVRIKARGRKELRADVSAALDAASTTGTAGDYQLPPIDLLLPPEPAAFEEQEQEVRRKARILEKTFANFGFHVRVVEVETGPVIAQFEVELEAGLRLAKIAGLADDLAIALRVPSVRIVAPIPGKNTVGIEVPNSQRQLVRLREVIEESGSISQRMRIPIFLGKDVAGNPMVADLTTLPHLLIAGRTGTGKSVCLNTIIVSMLMTRRPDEVKMLLIDPKMVELSPYKSLPHLMHPVVTDMRKAEAILGWAVDKMEERYALLARAGVRHLAVYNQLGCEELYERLQPETDEERAAIPTHLPYIVIVADEMADLMMTAAKEVETHIIRLAQKSRAVGIHLVLATQKPTVDVITGLIKSNLPARICFQVASRTDSRVVLDEMGADKLLGNGDMLFLWPGTSTLLRGQGTYVGDEELARIVQFVGTTQPEFVNELVQLKPKAAGGSSGPANHGDELYPQAVEIVLREGRGSVSLLQRTLGIGYGRAARLIDFMAEDGIVGMYNGSQAREVLISLAQWEAMCRAAEAEEAEAAAPARGPHRPARRGMTVASAAGTARRAGRARGEEGLEDESADGSEEDIAG
ncbi:MAG: DNA translocase FtsK 4TM domain-containing protein [Pirellulales bacterium]|nr:DNA translocase FtsK 4TM domain-containing protein [Pirellulales bacterium]